MKDTQRLERRRQPMRHETSSIKGSLPLLIVITIASLTAFLLPALPIRSADADSNKGALVVQAEAAQGRAAPGNTQPANFLIVVTEHDTGVPVTNLAQSDFQIINHFAVTGQVCGFSNNIVSFGNIGTGAYQIRVGLETSIPGCAWVGGDYLAQVIVTNGTSPGQATATLSVE
jgi:hypothetical protein